MNLNVRSKSLQISRIDFTDFSYAISPVRDIIIDENLRDSIARHGILHPPIIRETESDSYIIVRGRRRLHTFHSLYPEAGSCCCTLMPRNVPEIAVYSVLLEDILVSRQLTPIEKAIFLKKIAPLADTEYIVNEFLPRMNFPPDPFHIRQCLMLLDLEKPIIQAIHAGLVQESVARTLSRFPAADRKALFHIMNSLRLSVSYQKKLVQACREIAGREQKSIVELLENEEVKSILKHPGANPPQKTKNLMTWLNRRYMPRSTQAEAEFTGFVNAMQLPGNVEIQHTPYFEDDKITLSITFTHRKSLQNAWKEIKNAISKKDD